ncbi:wax ester/triacylglycerol synthase family O-acyltransferase [Mycobacterium sp. TNTM28]|uniref:Diacylglycerol O-acyltransferase n=1 Tax=[Mycobacterium] fortunisiensis TaxID=2600579 RepID=A0ABS6KRQ9_9MYCO|nr:wax ester/triacylglycerol synthase family O-acyltransferase [[Mycobacterium] fortunisiensis]MBU9766301.1 wax ester/triacylglycerol synthase family O-acyltransferase [[Mycobacterium] fortunisiensis]
MEQLTVLDAAFVEAEDSDPHASLAIGAVAVLAGPMPDAEAVVAALTERVMSVPRLRQLLHTQPLDLAAPHWVDDSNFDVAHHIRFTALPRPGDEAALNRLVAEVMERRLDRDRPLWECWIVDGLQHNRWALLMKVHHCVADGVAATRLLGQLCDDPVVGDDPAGPAARPGSNPVEWISGAWRTTRALPGAAVQAVRGAFDIAEGLLRPAAVSSLSGPISSMRRYAAVEVPLDEIEKVRSRFGVTVNDVALAAITDSFRTMLIRRGERPRRTSLRTLVPVSVRPTGARDALDNRVSVMLPYLPVEKEDPVAQLRSVHERMDRAKGSGQSQAGNLVVAAAKAIPFPLTAWTVRALTRLPQRGVVTLATSVAGPRATLRLMGRDVVRLLPIPPLALHLRTGIAIMSYTDRLVFGVIGDYDATPDVDELATGIERAVERLTAISTGHWRSTPVGTLLLVEGG